MKCNFKFINRNGEEIYCLIKANPYNKYQICDGEDCIFQRILKRGL